MKKAEFQYDINDLIINGDKEATMFPFAVGNIYSFTLSEMLFANRAEVIDGLLCKWTEAVTDDGVGISVRQLTRRNNGIILEGKTIKERIRSFVDQFDEDGHLILRIAKVVEREWLKPNGETTISKYLKFEII